MANEIPKQAKQEGSLVNLRKCLPNITAFRQTKHFTDILTTKLVCKCLKTRNMYKTLNAPASSVAEQSFRTRRKITTATTTTYRQTIRNNNNSIIKNGNEKKSSHQKPGNAYTTSIDLIDQPHYSAVMTAATEIKRNSSAKTNYGGALNNNLLQHLVGSVLWHVTASTAISIFALFHYFIANTQGAAAIAVEAAMPPLPPPLPTSLSASLAMYSSLAAMATVTATSSITPSTTPLPTLPLTSNLSFFLVPYHHRSNLSGIGVSAGASVSSSSNDFNYNFSMNSTEITILNGVSSLASNKISVYSNDNNNDSINSHIYKDNNNIITVSYNNGLSFNDSLGDISAEDTSEYIFDRTDVRIIFITLYTMVFCCCFFGNLLVILVVTLSRRLRSITNFFLANLALADFCVGLFCVMQNLSIYLIDSWVFGEFLCRMYQFVHSLSYTASIFILVVICMERYFAIVHPITCKQILTAARLRMVILTVWITSAVYSTPKFVFSKTIKNIHTESGREEEICVLDRKMFNSKLLDMINFGLLYVIPLLVMTILYSKIAIALWRSSRGLQHHLAQQENGMGMHNSMYHHHHHNHNHNHHSHHHQQQQQQQHLLQQQQQQQLTATLGTPISVNSSVVSAATTLSRKQSCKYDATKRGVSLTESQHDSYKVSLESDRPVVSACRKTSFYQHSHHNHLAHQQPASASTATSQHNRQLSQHGHHGLHSSQRVSHISHSSNNVLRARRGVVRMLIIFVLTFALCNLPYHARKMWQYWSRSYRGDSNFNALLTPLTFLVTYFNSGINPLLYAFLSRNFRKGMKELLMCSWRKSKTKSSTNSSMHHKRMTMQTHSLPTDTTHIGNEQL